MSVAEMIDRVEKLPVDAQLLVGDFIEILQRRYAQPDAPQMRDENLRRYFGAVRVGTPGGANNESIDADLARVYNNGVA
jgi:hypothetical protein